MQPFRLPPFEIADDHSAYQRQVIEVEGESGVAQCMVKVFLRRPLPLHRRTSLNESTIVVASLRTCRDCNEQSSGHGKRLEC